jgi:hypothetical protein
VYADASSRSNHGDHVAGADVRAPTDMKGRRDRVGDCCGFSRRQGLWNQQKIDCGEGEIFSISPIPGDPHNASEVPTQRLVREAAEVARSARQVEIANHPIADARRIHPRARGDNSSHHLVPRYARKILGPRPKVPTHVIEHRQPDSACLDLHQYLTRSCSWCLQFLVC